MKRHIKSKACMAMIVMSLTAMLTEPAAAKSKLLFKGLIQAVEESFPLFPPDVPFPTLFVEASGSGVATQLGKFAIVYEVEVNLDTFFGIGSAEFIAANGDRITTDFEGQGTVPTVDGISFIIETHIVTGGTGRFDGATGSFTLVRVIDVTSGVTAGSFGGTILKAK
jgi:hypothetical protein